MKSRLNLGLDEEKIIDHEIKKVMHGYIPYVKIGLSIILVMATKLYIMYSYTDLTELSNTKRGLAFTKLLILVFIYTLFCLT